MQKNRFITVYKTLKKQKNYPVKKRGQMHRKILTQKTVVS